ncbi:hypothetical protein JVT61DRAFT_12209 [Boletus reticuloceps]|uniref:PIN domain-containing protein n=1 Tax=Boletus reticuloceps TaxID=495285 RepID=A0A8I2YDY8_9AGAM|nr:hypothetical protein JVT61DRAFT_12209 [Boletus reticuloceps]
MFAGTAAISALPARVCATVTPSLFDTATKTASTPDYQIHSDIECCSRLQRPRTGHKHYFPFLSIVALIIESLRWTVVIPVPVIMELDGLGSNTTQLGEAAQEAVSYITFHIRLHATSLKVQTSKGN